MSTLVLNLDDTLVSRLASAAARSHKALPDWAAEQLGRLAGTFQQETEETVASPAKEQMRAALAVHADNEEFRAVFIAQGWIIHRVLNITNVSLGELDAGHGLRPLEDSQRLQFSSLFCHKS